MFHVHRAERADALAAALGELLAAAPADPFATEIVAVPARGIERWLTQQLSARLGISPHPPGRRDGICAGVAFPSPAELVADAIAVASGIAPEADPWRPERLVWPLLEVVESSLDEAWAEPIATHLGHNADPPEPHRATRRLGVVHHLAVLFDAYARHRPELVIGWSAREADAEAAGAPGSPSSGAWQAQLWRRLRARIAEPDPAARLAGACERLRAEPSLGAARAGLLFGLTRLPAATSRSFARWPPAATCTSSSCIRRRRCGTGPGVTGTCPAGRCAAVRSDRRPGRQPAAGLVGAGRAGAAGRARPAPARRRPPPRVSPTEPATLLERIQADIRADRAPPGAPRRPGAENRARC